MARPIDADAVKFSISGLSYISPYDYFALAEFFMKQVKEMPTLAPPNDPLTFDKKRVIAGSCLHYEKSGRCRLNGYAPLDCPRCKEWHSNESNEPLTIEQLREMDGEPVWFDTIKRWGIVRVRGYGIFVLTKSGEYDVTRMKIYRRPPEGEEETE